MGLREFLKNQRHPQAQRRRKREERRREHYKDLRAKAKKTPFGG
jgi:hypothetical protein